MTKLVVAELVSGIGYDDIRRVERYEVNDVDIVNIVDTMEAYKALVGEDTYEKVIEDDFAMLAMSDDSVFFVLTQDNIFFDNFMNEKYEANSEFVNYLVDKSLGVR